VVELLKCRCLRRLGTDLANVGNKILEILLSGFEEEVYSTQFFAAEETR
jgi:hypothetical protein